MNTLAFIIFFISVILTFVSIILLGLSGIKIIINRKNTSKEVLSTNILNNPKKILKIMGIFILINISSAIIGAVTMPAETNEKISIATTNNPVSSIDSSSSTTADKSTDLTTIEADTEPNDESNSNNNAVVDSTAPSNETNTIANDMNSSDSEIASTTDSDSTTYSSTTDDNSSAVYSSVSNNGEVWKTETGTKYHRDNNCGKTNSSNATLISKEEAENLGLEPCKKCYN